MDLKHQLPEVPSSLVRCDDCKYKTVESYVQGKITYTCELFGHLNSKMLHRCAAFVHWKEYCDRI